MSSDPVKEYKALKRKPRQEEALQLLKRLASQVKPVLVNHNWTIKNLCEFFPTNPNLLGVNVNHGWKINLRLRPHFDDTQFLEYDDILGTLLHEMAHIVVSPHDARFYKLLDELKEETELLMASGYSGEGFYSSGQQLGSRSVPRYLSKGIAASAAERRLQTSRIMLPTGGVRLGGSSSSAANRNMTPAMLAARAAQKRLEDKVWCGEDSEETESSGSTTTTTTAPKRKLSSNIPSMATPSNKKSRVTVDLTNEENEDGWSCLTCTFINDPIKLACQICLTERPHSKEEAIMPDLDTAQYWTCPKCTLQNELKWQVCVACSHVHLR